MAAVPLLGCQMRQLLSVPVHCHCPVTALCGSPEFPCALGATLLPVHLFKVVQRSGPFLIPTACKLGHPLHPIQSKAKNG